MKVFIGSSREQNEYALKVATWLEDIDKNITPVLWSDEDSFDLADFNWSQLIDIAHSVDAAIFIFAADDKTWFRGKKTDSVRDNVILEYGLFSGVISSSNVCFIRDKNADIPSDLQGIVYADIAKPASAHKKVVNWINKILNNNNNIVVANKGSYILSSLGTAFSTVLQKQSEFNKIRIFAISSIRSAQILRSHTEIKIKEAVVLLRKFAENDDYYQKSMDNAINTAIELWEHMNKLNNIETLSIPRFDFHPTFGFYIFDDKYLIYGNLSYFKATNKYAFDDNVLLFDSTTEAGKQFISESTRFFDNLISNYGESK